MNRLIILGNGFDLSHNLKTSYLDFISEYLFGALDYALRNRNGYDDRLINIKQFNVGIYQRTKNSNTDNKLNRIKEVLEFRINEEQLISIKSVFMQSICNSIVEFNWSDIELRFYNCLKKEYRYLSSIISRDFKKDDFNNLNELNEDLDFIINCLVKYLNKIELNIRDIVIKSQISDIILGKSTTNLFEKEIDKLLVVNFNYTSTIENYITFDNIQSQLVYIHGKLNSPINPIIFGYGDDKDSDYKGMLNLDIDDLLRYSKTVNYYANNESLKHLPFIESGDYEVIVLGHSLSVIDKSILSSIMGNANCKVIRLVYYVNQFGNNDYKQKSMSVNRLITNADEKLVRFIDSYPLN